MEPHSNSFRRSPLDVDSALRSVVLLLMSGVLLSRTSCPPSPQKEGTLPSPFGHIEDPPRRTWTGKGGTMTSVGSTFRG